MLIIDLRYNNITGKDAANAMDEAGITCNKNTVPFDTASPFVTSGIRLGTPACTTRGFKEAEFVEIAHMIADVLDGLSSSKSAIENVKNRVSLLCEKFPM
jgi:glycine hydroxymethyltransferase